MTAQACLARVKDKYSQDTPAEVWEDVLAHWAIPVKLKSLKSTLNRAKRRALGITDSLANHMKKVETTEEDGVWWYGGS